MARVPFDEPTYNLVLNKYPVIPHHFILTTKEYREQTDMLDEDDLAMAYSCLKSWEPGRLFAFFNSGEHSGASQRHRHIQFLPVEDMQKDCEDGGWVPLIDLMYRDGIKGPCYAQAAHLKGLTIAPIS